MYQFKANIFTILNSLIEQNIIQNHIIANVQCHKKFKLIAMEGPDDKKDRQSLTHTAGNVYLGPDHLLSFSILKKFEHV